MHNVSFFSVSKFRRKSYCTAKKAKTKRRKILRDRGGEAPIPSPAKRRGSRGGGHEQKNASIRLLLTSRFPIVSLASS